MKISALGFLLALLLQTALLMFLYNRYADVKAKFHQQMILTADQVDKNEELILLVDALNVSLSYAKSHLAGTKEQVSVATSKLKDAEAIVKRYMNEAAEHKERHDQLLSVMNHEQKHGLKEMLIEDEGRHKRLLCIGIPTVPRRNNERYLEQTLMEIEKQLPRREDDLWFGKIIIFIANNRPNSHPLFYEMKQKYESSPLSSYFRFIDNITPDPEPSSHDAGEVNKPGWRVRQQTRELVNMVRQAKDLASHYLFMEDDFLLCPNGLLALYYSIMKAHDYVSDFSALRVSYGMCGMIFQTKDMGEIANYLEKHQRRRPPDHLLPEWMMAETDESRNYLRGRRNAAFRHVLFHHIGTVSAIRDAKSPDYPKCYTPLVYPVVFENEGWRPSECPSDDIWPCQLASPEKNRWNKEIVDFTRVCVN